jgi:hypothetical protein
MTPAYLQNKKRLHMKEPPHTRPMRAVGLLYSFKTELLYLITSPFHPPKDTHIPLFSLAMISPNCVYNIFRPASMHKCKTPGGCILKKSFST